MMHLRQRDAQKTLCGRVFPPRVFTDPSVKMCKVCERSGRKRGYSGRSYLNGEWVVNLPATTRSVAATIMFLSRVGGTP